MKRVIAWVKHEPVLLSFLTLAAGNLAADLEAGKVTLAVVGSALLAAFGAMVRTQVTPVAAPDEPMQAHQPIRVELIAESEGFPRLGRHIEHDPRSLAYPVRDRLAVRAPLVSKRWTRRSHIFDQGQVGSCTGNAMAGWLALDNAVRPGRARVTEKTALEVYTLATELDSIPGTYPGQDTGSTGIAAAKALVKLGYAKGYTHGFSLDDVLRTLSQVGPGCLGLPWHQASFTPGPDGIVEITGSIEGGHEIVADEIDVERRLVGFDNSWNTTWGLHGRAYFRWSDLETLLHQGGDFTIPH